MGQGEYPLTLFIDPKPYKRIGCAAKYGQKHLHAKVSNAEAEEFDAPSFYALLISDIRYLWW